MRIHPIVVPWLLAALAACQPSAPSLQERATPPDIRATDEEASAPDPVAAREDSSRLADLIASAPPEATVCRRMVREIARAAERHPADTGAFLAALQDEFVGGTGDPFELEAGLRDGRWNRSYFYAGHGGFRPELDDAQRYPERGNHQPGHFVSVLSVAAGFGGEAARVAIAQAGDYEPADEDDLRLSTRAIEWGEGLRTGALRPAEVALRTAEMCR